MTRIGRWHRNLPPSSLPSGREKLVIESGGKVNIHEKHKELEQNGDQKWGDTVLGKSYVPPSTHSSTALAVEFCIPCEWALQCPSSKFHLCVSYMKYLSPPEAWSEHHCAYSRVKHFWWQTVDRKTLCIFILPSTESFNLQGLISCLRAYQYQFLLTSNHF